MQFLSSAKSEGPAFSGFHIRRAFFWFLIVGFITACGTARAAEKPRLQAGIRRVRAEPDREKRFREVVALDHSLRRSADIHCDALAGLVREAQLLA